jgi:hypothetical protein
MESWVDKLNMRDSLVREKCYFYLLFGIDVRDCEEEVNGEANGDISILMLNLLDESLNNIK